jgi:glycosyltransferase involved in cell wall biosynthesis
MTTRPRNVLYAVVHGDMGGVHRFLDSVMAHHHPDRVRPVVLAFRPGPWLDELRDRGVAVHCLDNPRLRQPFRCFRQVNQVLKNERIDLVHSAYAWPHAVTAPAAAWRGCRRVWFHHGPMSRRRWQGPQPLVPADLVLANSRFLLESLQQTFHWARQSGYVHYGIDAAAFAPDATLRAAFRKQWGLDDNALAVGIVGFIDTWKGQDIFLEAARRLRPSGRPIHWFVIGGPRDGLVAARCQAFERQLHEFVTRHGLGDVAHFTGPADVKAGALDGLDLFVHASTEPEPFGMVILEAMAKAKPILASAEGGPTEVITDGVDGLLIRPRCPETLAEAVRRLAEDAAFRENLAAAARQTVLTAFSPARAADRLEEWYDRLG